MWSVLPVFRWRTDVDGQLRAVRHAGREVLRAVAYVVRDADWGTLSVRREAETVDRSPDRIRIAYQARCTDPSGAVLAFDAEITVRTDGVAFEVTARPEADFTTNRCGFCVLHPVVGVAGMGTIPEDFSAAFAGDGAALARLKAAFMAGAEPLVAGNLSLDPDRREVRVDGRALELTYVEFELLKALAAQPGKVFSRRALLQAIWGDSAYREPRTIDVHVRHLREKIERDPSEPELILTMRGAGYRFRPE